MAEAGPGKRRATWQIAVTMKRIAPIRVVGFCLLAACGALGQSGRPRNRAHQGVRVNSTNVQRQQSGVLKSLPDAPLPQAVSPADSFPKVSELGRSPLIVSQARMNTDVAPETSSIVALPEAPSATVLYKPVPVQNKADAFFSKYLNPSSTNQASRYEPSSHDKVMERATDAASRIFITRDQSGKRRLNTPYFLRVLTSVAAGSASRRYRARSGSAPLSAFGSTIGSDAGMNLLHEFGPGIRQMVTAHMPEFVFRIQNRAVREPRPRPAASLRPR